MAKKKANKFDYKIMDSATSSSSTTSVGSFVPRASPLEWAEFNITPAPTDAPLESGTLIMIMKSTEKSGLPGYVRWTKDNYKTDTLLPAQALEHPAIILGRWSADFQCETEAGYRVAFVTSANCMPRANWLQERQVRHDLKGSLPLVYPNPEGEFFHPNVYDQEDPDKIPILYLDKDHPQLSSWKLSYVRTEGWGIVPRCRIRMFNYGGSFDNQPKVDFDSFKIVLEKLNITEDPYQLYHRSAAETAAKMRPSNSWEEYAEEAAARMKEYAELEADQNAKRIEAIKPTAPAEDKKEPVLEVDQYLENLKAIKTRAAAVTFGRTGDKLRSQLNQQKPVIHQFISSADAPSDLISRVLVHACGGSDLPVISLQAPKAIAVVAVNFASKFNGDDFQLYTDPILEQCGEVVARLVDSGRPLDSLYAFTTDSFTLILINDLAVCLCGIAR